MRRIRTAILLGTTVALCAPFAAGHVGVNSPLIANTSQEITFSVGHGCEGQDTLSVRVTIPAGVTSLRTVPTPFGKATLEKDNAGVVTAVTWQTDPADLLPEDTGYYKVGIRARVPNAPFTTILFPTRQTCRGADGGTTVVDWVAPTEVDGGPEVAPAANILPARTPGWNKYTVPAAISDLSVFFGDALIVWNGTAAYSANASTKELIGATNGVTELTSLAANDEIWVKY
jgi:periplasmic copper chaperone A